MLSRKAASQKTASDALKWWPGLTLDIVPEWIEQHCVVPDGDFDSDGRKPPFLLRDYQLCFVTNHYAIRETAEPGMKSSAFAEIRGPPIGQPLTTVEPKFNEFFRRRQLKLAAI